MPYAGLFSASFIHYIFVFITMIVVANVQLKCIVICIVIYKASDIQRYCYSTRCLSPVVSSRNSLQCVEHSLLTIDIQIFSNFTCTFPTIVTNGKQEQQETPLGCFVENQFEIERI